MFWKNWTYRLTEFKSGGGFVEMEYFSNSFVNCESTLIEAAKKLGVKGFGLQPAKGGGFIGTIIFTPKNMESE